ncbi:MAG: AMP-binding protein [Bacteroidales bacterium]
MNLIYNIKTLRDLYDYSTEKFKNNPLFSYVNGSCSYTYGEFKDKTDKISSILDNYGYNKGTKVAIWSQNMPNWPVAFFSAVAFERVSVPLLPDFTTSEAENILEHSESEVLFISEKMLKKLSEKSKNALSLIITLDSFEIVKEGKRDLGKIINPEFENLATIIYTSGTTGTSKGVMLSHQNLCATLNDAITLRPSYEWDIWLSILPLSHTLECSLSMLLPFFAGASVKYIEKAPTPSILIKAFQEVRPTTILSVPLIIEKVYRNSVLPNFKKNKIISAIYGTAIGRKLLHRIAGKKLMKQFGGRITFFGIGGAKLDKEVERFLFESKFPYAIGYGLTETSPLLAGAINDTRCIGSTGLSTVGVTLKIENPNPVTGEGEVVAKGNNVMMGYYKNPEATAAAFTKDGWFKTKDLGIFDKNKKLFLKGRLGNMIIGASGENIYPEEIESIVNSYAMVDSSIVTNKTGKLVALVQMSEDVTNSLYSIKDNVINNFNDIKERMYQAYEQRKAELKSKHNEDHEKLDSEYKKLDMANAIRNNALIRLYNIRLNNATRKNQEKIEKLKNEILNYVNNRVNKFSRVSIVIIQSEQFEKTATQKIKRYLYQ